MRARKQAVGIGLSCASGALVTGQVGVDPGQAQERLERLTPRRLSVHFVTNADATLLRRKALICAFF